jgi:DNA polymerase V
MANRYAKKTKRNTGVFWAANEKLVTEMLRHTEVGEICGIGPKYAVFLQRNGFRTAEDFARAPEEWVRVNMSVVGQRLLNEIRGIPAIASGPEVPVKKNICTSRSFGNLLYSKMDIAEALSNHAAACAFKLRQQRSCCRSLTVFIQTNPHKRELPQYARSLEIDLERASNNTPEIIKYVMGAFNMIFKEGFAYKKAGVIVTGLVPEQTVQQSVFDNSDNDRNQLVMRTLDAVNRSLGKESVRMAVQGFEKRYRLRAEHLSRKYTTNIDHVIKVRN